VLEWRLEVETVTPGGRDLERVDRRRFFARAAAGLAVLAAPAALGQSNTGLIGSAATVASPAPPPDLSRRARAELDRLGPLIRHQDVVAIADFGRPSWEPRLHLADMTCGAVTSFLVAHGCGSDLAFSGWLGAFSNEPGSQASSAGAFRTTGFYAGAHGRSMRLEGLDPSNSNARRRDVVIHAADYVSPEVVRDIGKLGWSEGCFAIDHRDLALVLGRLGPGRLLISTRIETLGRAA
jgi:hypothetical protein